MRRRYLGPLALLLAAAFFANQAFACCYANARFARALSTLLSPRPPAHACCAKPAPAPEKEKGNCSRQCCLKAESRSAPQLPSAPAELPDTIGPAARIVLAPVFPIAFMPAAAPIADTGPPVYLRTLRLLV